MIKTPKNSKFKIQNSKFLFQQGMALIWALFVSMMILVFGFTLVTITVKELRIASNFDESGRAYSAAEAGIERALYEVKIQTSTDIKWGCDPAIDPPLVFSETLDSATNLRYSATLQSTCDNNKRVITIKSTGNSGGGATSRGVNTRKIRTDLTLTPPNNIDKFDISTGLGLPTFNYFNPQLRGYSIPSEPIIVQQLDLSNLDSTTVGGGFTVGMSNGTPGATDFGINFSQVAGNRVRVKLAGRVRGLPQFSSNQFDFSANNSSTYRVKIEYARYGAPAGVGGFTIIKATVLRRNISGNTEKFECLGNNQGYVVYTSSPVNLRGDDLTNVKVNIGSWVSDNPTNPVLPGGYIRVGNDAKLDNMAFWGRK